MTAWSKTPPSDDGYYWVRLDDRYITFMERDSVRRSGAVWVRAGIDMPSTTQELIDEGADFWPERIEPPEEEVASAFSWWRCTGCFVVIQTPADESAIHDCEFPDATLERVYAHGGRFVRSSVERVE